MPVPYNPSGGKTYTLQSSISSTQTTITLSSFTVPVSGTAITMAVMNTTIAYMTIAPRTSQSEFISFTGVTQNADGTATLTGVTRGLDKNSPFTSSSTFKLPHAGSTQVILSDAPQVFNQYSVIANDETITGRKVYPTSGSASSPLVGVTYSAPTQDTEIASKKYVDVTAIFGAPFATTTTAGIVQLPTQAQVEAGTAIGSTLAGLALPNEKYGARNYLGYARDGGSVNTFTVSVIPTPTAYATGQVIGFQSTTTNTQNSTVNISALGAKNLFQGGTGLFPGVISTNSIVGAVYDGTQFDVIWISDGDATSATARKTALRNSTGDITVSTTPTASTDAASKAYADSLVATYKNGTTTKNAADASSTQTIAHGLGKTPKYVRVTCTLWSGSFPASGSTINALAFANSVYNGTTQSSQSFYANDATPGAAPIQDTTFTLNLSNGAGKTVGVITVDTTNISIAWTKTSSPTGTYNVLWEAFA